MTTISSSVHLMRLVQEYIGSCQLTMTLETLERELALKEAKGELCIFIIFS
jgi:hypothetical protein